MRGLPDLWPGPPRWSLRVVWADRDGHPGNADARDLIKTSRTFWPAPDFRDDVRGERQDKSLLIFASPSI